MTVFLANKAHPDAITTLLSVQSNLALMTLDVKLSGMERWFFTALAVGVLWLLLWLIVESMIPFGRCIGKYLDDAGDTITAYSFNLAGSIVGLWLLALLALFWLSPIYWFGIAFLLVLVCQPFSWRNSAISVLLFAGAFLLLRIPAPRQVYWSPYQKLELTSLGDDQYRINVNNQLYMQIANVSTAMLAHNADLGQEYQNSSYDSPFKFAEHPNRALIIGSGAGNDVAAALRHGARHVDAVEIDPLIYSLGKRLHPGTPV